MRFHFGEIFIDRDRTQCMLVCLDYGIALICLNGRCKGISKGGVYHNIEVQYEHDEKGNVLDRYITELPLSHTKDFGLSEKYKGKR